MIFFQSQYILILKNNITRISFSLAFVFIILSTQEASSTEGNIPDDCYKGLTRSQQYLTQVGEQKREQSSVLQSSRQYLEEVAEGMSLIKKHSPNQSVDFLSAELRLVIFIESGMFRRILIQYFTELKGLSTYQEIYNSWKMMKSTLAFGGESSLVMADTEVSNLLSLLPTNLPEFSTHNAQSINELTRELRLTSDQYAALAALVNDQSAENQELLRIGFANRFFQADDRLMKSIATEASYLKRHSRTAVNIPLSHQERSLSWKQHIDHLTAAFSQKRAQRFILSYLNTVVTNHELSAKELADIVLHYTPYGVPWYLKNDGVYFRTHHFYAPPTIVKQTIGRFRAINGPDFPFDLHIMLLGLKKTKSVGADFPLEKFKQEFLRKMGQSQFRKWNSQSKSNVFNHIHAEFERLRELQLGR